MAITTRVPGRRGRSARASLPWGPPSVYFIALLVIALMLGPVAYIIIGGFRTNSEITQDPAGLPATWQFENYLNVLTSDVFWREVLNSSIAAIATTLFVVTLGLMAAYVLARYRFRMRGVLYAVFAAG